jgi:hypothetical protein
MIPLQTRISSAAKQHSRKPISSIMVTSNMGDGMSISVGAMLGEEDSRTGIISCIEKTDTGGFRVHATAREGYLFVLSEIHPSTTDTVHISYFRSQYDYVRTAFEPFFEESVALIHLQDNVYLVLNQFEDEDDELINFASYVRMDEEGTILSEWGLNEDEPETD